MKRSLFALGGLVLACVACRDPKCDEMKPSPSAAAVASAAEAPKRKPFEGVDEEEARALCALAAVPTPPEYRGNNSWDSSVIAAKKSGRRFGWVKMMGVADKLKPDDVAFYLMGVDVGRANSGAAFGACGRFREDPERKVLITLTYRTSGDDRKGDYLIYAALGMGHSNPNGKHFPLKGVSENDAKVAVLKEARDLIGEPDLEQKSGALNDWTKALEGR